MPGGRRRPDLDPGARSRRRGLGPGVGHLPERIGAAATPTCTSAPLGYSLDQLGSTLRLPAAGGPVTVAADAGQIALALFDGTQGQNLSVALADTAGETAYFLVLDPLGAQLLPLSPFPTSNAYFLPPLPMTGTYEIVVEAQTAPLAATVEVTEDPHALLAPGRCGRHLSKQRRRAGAVHLPSERPRRL